MTQLALGGAVTLRCSAGTTKFQLQFVPQTASTTWELGVFGLRDKGGAVDPPSWPGNTGDLPARPPGRPSGIAGCSPHPSLSSVGRRVGGRAAPLGSGTHHLLSMAPPAPLLGRTPGAACARLDLHVHRADVARLVLSDPQLPVFGWVHFSKQLVHRLDCLQGMEKRGRRQGQQRPGHCLRARLPASPLSQQPLRGLGAPGEAREGQTCRGCESGSRDLSSHPVSHSST